MGVLQHSFGLYRCCGLAKRFRLVLLRWLHIRRVDTKQYLCVKVDVVDGLFLCLAHIFSSGVRSELSSTGESGDYELSDYKALQ